MLTDKEIISFQKNGYLIKKSKELDSINYLQNKVFNLISKKNKNLNNIKKSNKTVFFQKLHKHINKKKLNEIRLSVVNGINSDSKFYKSYYKSAAEMLDGLVGNEIAMQKKINISIQIPNDEKSMLPMHSDIYAGESPFEVVAWIPLTDVKKSTHSMFITSPKENPKINKEVTKSKNKTVIKIFNKYKKKFKFLEIKFGEVLIFTPILLHGNVVNKTKETRISLNCRFKNLLTPYDVFSKTHRNIPHFFKPLIIKPLTKIGFNFINAVNKKKYNSNL